MKTAFKIPPLTGFLFLLTFSHCSIPPQKTLREDLPAIKRFHLVVTPVQIENSPNSMEIAKVDYLPGFYSVSCSGKNGNPDSVYTFTAKGKCEQCRGGSWELFNQSSKDLRKWYEDRYRQQLEIPLASDAESEQIPELREIENSTLPIYSRVLDKQINQLVREHPNDAFLVIISAIAFNKSETETFSYETNNIPDCQENDTARLKVPTDLFPSMSVQAKAIKILVSGHYLLDEKKKIPRDYFYKPFRHSNIEDYAGGTIWFKATAPAHIKDIQWNSMFSASLGNPVPGDFSYFTFAPPQYDYNHTSTGNTVQQEILDTAGANIDSVSRFLNLYYTQESEAPGPEEMKDR